MDIFAALCIVTRTKAVIILLQIAVFFSLAGCVVSTIVKRKVKKKYKVLISTRFVITEGGGKITATNCKQKAVSLTGYMTN